MEQEAPPRENIPLLGDSRNALRSSMLQILSNLSNNSRIYLFFKSIISLLKILAMSLILALTSTNTEEPLSTFIYILISAEAGSTAASSYYLLTDPEDRAGATKRIISAIDYLAAL